MSRGRSVLLALVAAAALPAQDPDQVRGALQRAQRELQQARGDADMLLEARLRYDLGLPPVGELDCLRGDASAANAPAIERAQHQLANEDATTASLVTRYEQLRRHVEQLQRDAQQHAAQPRNDEEWITVPVAGAAATEPRPGTPQPPIGQSPAPAGEAAPAVPVATNSDVRVVPNFGPIRAQIDGSQDHGRVAEALFRAARSLVDRADEMRRQQNTAAADQLDDAARERLLRAVDELQPVADLKTGAFAQLFLLGRSNELLFRIAERRDGLSAKNDNKTYQRREQEVRDVFVAISARDVVSRGGNERLGPWGSAAQAALDHFRWMNLHAGFQPKTRLDAITWTRTP